MIERILNAILESPIGMGVLSGILGYWLINRLSGNTQSGLDSMFKINKETGFTEREELLLQLEKLKAKNTVLEATLNLERRLKEAELQLVAVEALYGIPRTDEGKRSPVLDQAREIHRLKYKPVNQSINGEG